MSDSPYIHQFTPYLVCPHCGESNLKRQRTLKKNKLKIVNCEKCKKKFTAQKNVSTQYFSEFVLDLPNSN